MSHYIKDSLNQNKKAKFILILIIILQLIYIANKKVQDYWIGVNETLFVSVLRWVVWNVFRKNSLLDRRSNFIILESNWIERLY